MKTHRSRDRWPRGGYERGVSWDGLSVATAGIGDGRGDKDDLYLVARLRCQLGEVHLHGFWAKD